MTATWIFDPAPPSGSRKGGLANAQVFPSDIDAFVREVLQNARDQKLQDDKAVEVRFVLEELSGSAMEDFLDASGWGELKAHVKATAAEDYVTISPRLRQDLDRLERHGRIRLLRIEDRGTRGLTGDEDEEESNFNALCRHELITAAGRRESGGSFGLGKSVLWRFSGLSTVLFSSRLSGGGCRARFFGRALLPWHKTTEGSWEGSGWFGVHDPDPDLQRTVSLFDEPARGLASACRMEVPDGETGTTIVIVAFDEPANELEREIPEICEDILASAVRWFWPALVQGEITVQVEGLTDGMMEFGQYAQVHVSEVAPFVMAQRDMPGVSGLAEAPGEIAEREIAISVPRQRPERFDRPRDATTAQATLRIRLAEADESAHLNTVALQRGTGMVVRYYEPSRRYGADQGFHAALIAGRAHGNAESDQALEEFLRAAEPPAHSEWTHTTERIKAEYAQGARKAVEELLRAIDSTVRELTREETIESDEGPDALRKLFPLPGIGGAPERRPPLRLSEAAGRLAGNAWHFTGTYARQEVPDESWRFRVALSLDQEGGSGATTRGDRLAIASLSTDWGETYEPGGDGSCEVIVPKGVRQVRFTGESAEVSELPPGGSRRVRLRLDVRQINGKEIS